MDQNVTHQVVLNFVELQDIMLTYDWSVASSMVKQLLGMYTNSVYGYD